ncbi:hypothetical protein GCM10025867_35950 [Frondihabitans sucicola]|uniref:Xaa-Pro dipeptidyl-peptidase C-terminal domain-containing protein n=1 Tax=Frondihabitans sucicola TaxID=1268041 RepID=A0ABN6Y2R9_9MICO|nr:hypothetical protein [Frondihabitans sucicola]BDZ51354.1 hypothetical protein GCM10025867_35950 [Frondihabitans sucicola]
MTAGTWDRDDDAACFTPRFAAVPGTGYVVLGRPEGPGRDWRELARTEAPRAERRSSTVVEAIEPGSGEVPANLLRFSVTFSAPMEEGSAAGHVHLLDETGHESAGSLLEMPPELWDRNRRRLTVLLEPGRIKRGLQPHVRAGAPIRAGGRVTLVVDAELRDATGAPLSSAARRTYRVGPPVRSRVDPALWEVRWPTAAGEPLVLRFDRGLDSTLVRRYLRVTDGHGVPVPGRAALDPAATLWSFTPDSGRPCTRCTST